METFQMMNYKPYQSISETRSKCNIIYSTGYAPGRHLKPYVESYWTMVSAVELQKSIHHRVIPDGCVDIIFDLNVGSYREAASVVGTMTRPIFAELKKRVNYMAIRFLPGGAFRFLGNPTSDFTDQIIPLEAVSGREGHNLVEQLTSGNLVEDKIVLLENYLTELLSTGYGSDVAVEGALNAILRNNGNIRVSELATASGCSERQLRRKFDRWVGVAPKVFCQIIRFQRVIPLLRRGAGQNSLFAALDSGYYDQSHFIHEFNSYYGLSPSKFLEIKKL